ncbi:MAG: replication initiation factor domain-containing protein [Planctomycetota bacterium]
MWGYAERRQFAFGAFVTHSDEDRPECCIELPGDTCQLLGPDDLLQLIAWVYDQGGKATRIDVRIDFRGEGLNLIDQVHDACERRQLCRCRRWTPQQPRTSDGSYLGRGVNLGRRGKDGSGRYVRIYDKGLETGESSPRTWERWETEFSKHAADQVAQRLIESEAWEQDAVAVALGAIDFRDWTGSASLDRRPRSAWWTAYLAGVKPVLVRVQRTPTNLNRWGSWMRRCVLSTLTTIAHEAGQNVEGIIDFLSEGKPLPRSDSPVVWEYLDELANALSAGQRHFE